MKIRLSFFMILMLVCVLFMSACKPVVKPAGETPGRTTETTPEQVQGVPSTDVTIKTSDGFTIAGSFKKGEGNDLMPAMLLVHQLGADMTSYAALSDSLAKAGINSLAIDLRGHGKSTADGTINGSTFTDEQWAAATADLEAGLTYLRTQPSVDKNRIGIVGASIGANLAVLVAANDMVKGTEPAITCMVLLSPGVQYHGIQPLQRARDLGHLPVMIISGTADTQSYPGSQALSNAARGSVLESFNGRAHGTELFTSDPTLLAKAIDWIKANDNPRQREVEGGNTSGAPPSAPTGKPGAPSKPPAPPTPSGGR
jgi:dienelactone hydrolase